MAVIVTLVLWCGAVVHQHVLGMVFDVSAVAGDYLPAVTVAFLLVLRLRLSLYKRLGMFETVLALGPLLACLAILVPNGFAPARGAAWEMLWHPPVLLAVTFVAIGAMCWRVRCSQLYIVAIAYALGIYLTWGFNPELPNTLNHKPVAALLFGLPFLYSLVRRHLALSIAVASIAFVLAFGGGVFDCLQSVRMSAPFTTALGFWGTAMLVIAWRCRDQAPRIVRALGALALMFSAFGALSVASAVSWYDVGFTAATLFACAAVWHCFRDPLPGVLLCLPILFRVWTLTDRCAAWRYVGVSFLLLFAGAAISVRKARRRRRAVDEATTR